jgi:hypothetical protein
MKKKILAILLAVALCLGCGMLSGCGTSQSAATTAPSAAATEEPAATATAMPAPTVEPATVYVTVSDAGSLVEAQQPVSVTDEDGDGTLTVNDALIAAHDSFYPGGAAAGYATEKGQYGLSITKLWGAENGGSYGYYVNNVASLSLADPVAAGDYLTAFSYSDLTNFSDAYSYFDSQTAAVATGADLTLKLTYIGFDASFNPVENPAAGATIMVDGEQTEVVTGDDGTVTLNFAGAGTHVVSAVSDTLTLVPPVCTVTVG